MDKVTNKIRHSQLFYYQLISLFLHKSFPKNISFILQDAC